MSSKVFKNEYSCAKSWKDYWLDLPMIAMLSVPYSPHVFEKYLDWTTERDAKVRKAIYPNLISVKSMREDDSP